MSIYNTNNMNKSSIVNTPLNHIGVLKRNQQKNKYFKKGKLLSDLCLFKSRINLRGKFMNMSLLDKKCINQGNKDILKKDKVLNSVKSFKKQGDRMKLYTAMNISYVHNDAIKYLSVYKKLAKSNKMLKQLMSKKLEFDKSNETVKPLNRSVSFTKTITQTNNNPKPNTSMILKKIFETKKCLKEFPTIDQCKDTHKREFKSFNRIKAKPHDKIHSLFITVLLILTQ